MVKYKTALIKKLLSCRLDRNDLIDLEKVVSKDLEISKGDRWVSFHHNTYEVTNEKVRGLLKMPGLPKKVFRCELAAYDKKRWISISFERSSATSTVRGQDREWVDGRQERIADLIKKSKTLNYIFHSPWFLLLAVMPLFFSFGLLLLKPEIAERLSVGLFGITSFIFLMSLTVFAGRIFPYSIIEIKKGKTSLLLALIIGIIASIIAAIIVYLLIKVHLI